MPAAETAMAAAKATGVTTTATMTSTMLRPDGYSQEKRQRRDGPQATHTPTL